MTALRIPAPAPEDKIPHQHAVWRDYHGHGCQPNMTGSLPVSVDYGGGQIVQGVADEVTWRGVVRWRFGWGPSA